MVKKDTPKDQMTKSRTRHDRHPIEYGIVFRFVFTGTFFLTLSMLALLVVSYAIVDNHQVLGRIFLCLAALVYLGIIFILWKYGKKVIAVCLLITFYWLLAVFCLYSWGINAPIGTLLLAITIILAGILIGPLTTLFVAAASVVGLFILQLQITLGGYTPALSSSLQPSHMGDVAAYGVALSMLALISWLFGRQVERLFYGMNRAEYELRQEKALLEMRVEERTQQLQQQQLQEIQQLYQFLEMGQLSAALLHDLANHLTTLTFDIADLQDYKPAAPLKRAQESIDYLEQMIKEVRQQLRGKDSAKRFNLVEYVDTSITLLEKKAQASHVDLSFTSTITKSYITGDPLRLRYLLSILVTNSIEAYKLSDKDRRIEVVIEKRDGVVCIIVRDWSKGMSKQLAANLFSPIQSKKKNGMGVGLFIAKQIVEIHLKGTIALTSSRRPTEFVVMLPSRDGR
jgi:signal transduction histidine kinase